MKGAVVAICDEASADINILHEYIVQLIPNAKIKTFLTGQDMIRKLQQDSYAFDLIFIDPNMEEECGVRTAERIRRINKRVPIIFTSITEKFYRKAFDLFVYQYLIKPINIEPVEEVIDMWKGEDENSETRILHFKYRSQIYTYRHRDIAYISSSLHTVNFHLTKGKVVHCRGKLTDFDEQLENSSFVRCHQSFYVNIAEVHGMKSDCFVMRDCEIPISRSYLKEAQKAYKDYLADIAK